MNGQAVYEDVFSLAMNAVHPIIQGEGVEPRYPELNFNILVEGEPIGKLAE